METLEVIRDLLQENIDSIDKAIELELVLKGVFDRLKNENIEIVDFLHKLDLNPLIQGLNLEKQILLTLKFRVECYIEDNKKQEKEHKE